MNVDSVDLREIVNDRYETFPLRPRSDDEDSFRRTLFTYKINATSVIGLAHFPLKCSTNSVVLFRSFNKQLIKCSKSKAVNCIRISSLCWRWFQERSTFQSRWWCVHSRSRWWCLRSSSTGGTVAWVLRGQVLSDDQIRNGHSIFKLWLICGSCCVLLLGLIPTGRSCDKLGLCQWFRWCWWERRAFRL